MPDLDELLAFNRVMETGSLTRSAAELGLAKSTLSRRISQLESRLGQPLLRRQANQLLPTEAGHRYYAISQQILELADEGQRALDSLREEVSGEVLLEAHRTLTRSWLGRAMREFLVQHPAVSVALHTRPTPPRDPEFRGVSVWLGEVGEGGLRQEVIGRLERGIYAHPDYLRRHGQPDHPQALTRYAWIDMIGETDNGLVLRHPDGDEVNFHPPGSRFRVDQPMLHIDAIAGGGGLGVLPCWIAESRERAHPGELVRCLEDWQLKPLDVTLLYGFGRQPRKVTALLEHLRQSRPDAWQEKPAAANRQMSHTGPQAAAPGSHT